GRRPLAGPPAYWATGPPRRGGDGSTSVKCATTRQPASTGDASGTTHRPGSPAPGSAVSASQARPPFRDGSGTSNGTPQSRTGPNVNPASDGGSCPAQPPTARPLRVP